ncbi:MAG: Flp pilus assembly protein CpaB [Pirellulaceae bacterium]|nr:Flp pilus assembly protein CpaB [Pirellulaceae bacterium]
MVLMTVALGSGVIAAFAAFQVIQGGEGSSQGPQMEKVFVALTDIDINEKLNAENVKLEEWPRDRIPEGAIRALEDLEGKFARTRLVTNEIVLEAKLMDEGDRNAAAAISIPAGFRVCTVKVDIDNGNGGLVTPGDRVDIMVFLRRMGNEITNTSIRTILQDVRVFAVNAETERVTSKEGTAVTAKTISFLVKPNQAAKLTLASRIGILQLSLRRPGEEQFNASSEIGDISIDAILGGGAEAADDPQVKQPSPLINFLNKTPDESVETTIPVQWKMDILEGPNGTRSFEWTDEDELPSLAGGAPQTTPGLSEPLSGAKPVAATPKPEPVTIGDGDARDEELDDPLGDDAY